MGDPGMRRACIISIGEQNIAGQVASSREL